MILFFQPNLHGTSEQNNYNKKSFLLFNSAIQRVNFYANSYINAELNVYHQFTYFTFIGSCAYASSFLPYGKFYNRLGGNIGMLSAYMYIFIYLGFSLFRRPFILELFIFNLFNKVGHLVRKIKIVRAGGLDKFKKIKLKTKKRPKLVLRE